MNITVLGAGNWGTTAALLLHGNDHRVTIWEFFEPLARAIIEKRENTRYLPGVQIPDDVRVTWSPEEAVKDTDMVVFAVPSAFMRTTARLFADAGVPAGAVLASLSKGLEFHSLTTMTGIIGEELPQRPTVALSGPCIASEVARSLPTTIVAASENGETARIAQDVFMTPRFRVYTSDDPRGVQLGGALKNIIAIAAGICDGLGFGANAKSALVTRGIVEIKRFGTSIGARAETFNGLSGIGDLITTCFSPHSRNRRVGEELARGRRLEEILEDMVMVAEGVPTTKAVHAYALERSIDLPITSVVHGVLFEDLSPERAVTELMLRDRKPEHHPHDIGSGTDV